VRQVPAQTLDEIVVVHAAAAHEAAVGKPRKEPLGRPSHALDRHLRQSGQHVVGFTSGSQHGISHRLERSPPESLVAGALGWGAGEVGILQKALEHGRAHAPPRASGSVHVHRRRASRCPVSGSIDQRIPGPGIERNQILGLFRGQVGHVRKPSDVEHGARLVRTAEHSPVQVGRERRQHDERDHQRKDQACAHRDVSCGQPGEHHEHDRKAREHQEKVEDVYGQKIRQHGGRSP